MKAPLHGIRIVEFEGIGPGPLAGRMLADMGADVTVIVRPGVAAVAEKLGASQGTMRRGKRVIELDLKEPAHRAQAAELVVEADALIEGHRPGVMERLGLGPSEFAERNPKLVYGRMTGWGQHGPLAQAAGHDLNYVALTGMLALSAHRGQKPIVPPGVVGDAAGALGLAFGIVSALLGARDGGCGRVVDAAIVDITAMLGAIAQWIAGDAELNGPAPIHDSPFYDVYACADGGHITIGALEPQFYALLLSKLGMTDVDPAAQFDKAAWPSLKARLSAVFASRSRAHWCDLLEGTDVCFAPVLSVAEARAHPHNAARRTLAMSGVGAIHSEAAPRFLPLKAH
jgi:alpha-methylacyl-CoA racemase